MTGKITWLKADDIAARDDIPFNSRDTVYKAARANAIPHWNPGGMAKKSTLFPLEIIQQWLADACVIWTQSKTVNLFDCKSSPDQCP